MDIMEWNRSLFQAINNLGKDYTFLNPVFIFLAEYMQYFLALFLVIFWFTRIQKNRMMVIQAFLAFILAEVFGKIASQFHRNLQPFVEMSGVNKLIDKAVNNSFPSDHTILFFSICVSIWLVRRNQWFIWLPLACLVALSRIWVGVHYPADVLTGIILASLAAWIMYKIVPHLKIVKMLLGWYEKAESRVLPSRSRDFHQ